MILLPTISIPNYLLIVDENVIMCLRSLLLSATPHCFQHTTHHCFLYKFRLQSDRQEIIWQNEQQYGKLVALQKMLYLPHTFPLLLLLETFLWWPLPARWPVLQNMNLLYTVWPLSCSLYLILVSCYITSFSVYHSAMMHLSLIIIPTLTICWLLSQEDACWQSFSFPLQLFGLESMP